MRLRTLGALELEGSGFAKPVPLLLLAYLTVVGTSTRGHLASTLYPDARDSSDSLSTALRQLRTACGGVDPVERDGDRITSRVGCDVLDLDQAAAEQRFDTVCDVYGGTFLAGIEQRPYVDPERWSERLRVWLRHERLRVASVVLNAAARLAQVRFDAGDHDASARYRQLALGVVRDHVDDDDFEPARARLQASDLRTLYAVMVGSGDELAQELTALVEPYAGLELDGAATAGRPHRVAVATTNLTPSKEAPVGRGREQAAVVSRLLDERSGYVTIVGPGGVGKTTLAVEAARALYARGTYPGGAHIVRLDDVRFANLVPVRIAATLGLALTPARDALDQVIDALADQDAVVVLDTYEHVLERRDVPQRLALSCPGLAVIVTSRERLATDGEDVVGLDGLEVPPVGASAADVEASAAVRLFRRCARRRTANPRETDDVQAAIAAICRQAQGHPLTIELAAGLIDVLPLDEIARRLESDISVLTDDTVDRPQRQRSLRSVWQASWDLLDDDHRRALRRLAVFDGGFDWQAADVIAEATPLHLRRLVDASMMAVERPGRFAFHAMVVPFVRERFDGDAERDVLVRRHRLHFLERARSLAPRLRGAEGRSALAFFESEGANLRAAWSRADDLEELIAFVDVLEAPHERLGAFEERQALLERTLERARAVGRRDALPRLLTGLGAIRLERGEVEVAERLLTEALAEAETDDDSTTTIEALSHLGGVRFQRRELGAALALFERARRLAHDAGDARRAVAEASNVGAVHFMQGNIEEAVRTWRDALTQQRRANDLENQALLLNNLGAAHKVAGRLEDAVMAFEAAAELMDRIGDARGRVAADLNVASVQFLRGAFQEAVTIYEHALDAYRRHGDRDGEALVLNNLGMVHERRGALSDAERLLLHALALQEDDDERVHRAVTLHNLSTVVLQRGRVERAEALARASLELADETGDVQAGAYATLFLGDALRAGGDPDAAKAAYDRAAEAFEAIPDAAGIAEVAVRLAEHALDSGAVDVVEQHVRRALDVTLERALAPQAHRALRIAARWARASGDVSSARSFEAKARAMERRMGLPGDTNGTGSS